MQQRILLLHFDASGVCIATVNLHGVEVRPVRTRCSSVDQCVGTRPGARSEYLQMRQELVICSRFQWHVQHGREAAHPQEQRAESAL